MEIVIRDTTTNSLTKTKNGRGSLTKSNACDQRDLIGGGRWMKKLDESSAGPKSGTYHGLHIFRYDPEMDGRILLAKVDCTVEGELCRRNHIQGYPSIRIFRKGSDVRNEHGHHEHESYYGDRDTETLIKVLAEEQKKSLGAKMSSGFHTLRKAKRKTPVFNYQLRKENKLIIGGRALLVHMLDQDWIY